MKWIKRIEGGLKRGRTRAPLSPSVLECRPLVIVRQDGEVLFSGEASVEITVDKDGESARVASPSTPAPKILVRQSKQTPANSAIDATRPGQVLYGDDAEGVHYAWRIDGAAERYLESPWPQRWPRFW